jgi:hypothetical protein
VAAEAEAEVETVRTAVGLRTAPDAVEGATRQAQVRILTASQKND